MPIDFRPRFDWDEPPGKSISGLHVGAGLVVHHWWGGQWAVSDGVTGLWIAASRDPRQAMAAAYRRLVIERGRPSDLDGTVIKAVTAILRRVRRGLPAHVRRGLPLHP